MPTVEGLDRGWIEAALRRDPAGLAALAERCAIVPGILRARLSRHATILPAADLEDLEQEVLTAVWRNLGTFSGSSSFSTWLYGVCVKQVYQHLEQRNRNKRVRELSPVAPEPVDPRSLDARDAPDVLDVDTERLAEALGRLRPPVDRVVELRFLAGYPLERIARELDLPLGTVKTHLYRGLRRLREHLERGSQRRGGKR